MVGMDDGLLSSMWLMVEPLFFLDSSDFQEASLTAKGPRRKIFLVYC